MTAPFKLRVLRAVTDAIKEITVADGYETDLNDYDPGDGHMSSRVFRGRAWFGEADALPMVSLLEGVNPADEVGEPPVNTTSGEYDWPILVQGFVQDDPANPTDPAYVLMADVRRRCALEAVRDPVTHDPPLFGCGTGKNRITKISIGPGVVRPADDVSAKAYFWFVLTLRVVDNPEHPLL